MNKRIAILYSSTDGQTLKICERIAVHLENTGFIPELFEVSVFSKNLSEYSMVIIGASIRYGKHHKNVLDFIRQHRGELDRIATAFFSVNLVARKSDKNTSDTNPYLLKFLKQLDWRPTITDVFAGRLDYMAYSFLDRLLIKLIMKMTKGPTKSDKPIEYTDWNRVRDFAAKISLIHQKP